MKAAAAPILSLAAFAVLRSAPRTFLGRVVATSGGFDPLHAGHVACLLSAAALGDTLVVIVNGDEFLTAKKGAPFQDLATRCALVAAIRGVDFVIAFEVAGDPTVAQALAAIRPAIFAKGGDRVAGVTLPAAEEAVCAELAIAIVDGVGGCKIASSSERLAAWTSRSLPTEEPAHHA